MGLLDELPPNYVFTEEDNERAWDILTQSLFAPMDQMRDMTLEEESFYWPVHHAERIRCIIGRWPNVREVREFLAKEQAAAQQ